MFNDKESEIREYIGEDGHFSSKFDFSPELCGKNGRWDLNEDVTAEMYKNVIFDSQLRTGEIGFLSNIIENHDEPRGVSRYIPADDLSEQSKKALAEAYFFLRGIPFIYQGQEIGMENLPVLPIEQVDDISALDQYQVSLDAGFTPEEALKIISLRNRDNARTPVQWNTEKNAGFTQGTPWLMVNPNYTKINVESQEKDANSVLSFYKELIALRKNPAYKETIVYGDVIPFEEDRHNLMAYHRKADKDLLVIGNFQKEAQNVTLPSECKNILINNYPDAEINGTEVQLKGYQVLVLEL